MKLLSHRALLGLAAALSLLPPAVAGKHATALRGWVSDESCGALHARLGREDCVAKCRRGGAFVGHPEWLPQRLVIVSDRGKKIWLVENPELLDGREGRHVQVTGRFDAAKKSVRIETITEILNLRRDPEHRARRNPCHMAR